MPARMEYVSPSGREDTLLSRRHAVERVIVAMHERLDEPLSLHDISRIAYISPYHFNRVFHQITGVPPIKFLSAVRLDAAKRLLLTTSLSVTNVCFQVGYNSPGTFTSRFTELVGLSPSQFRRLADRMDLTSLDGLRAHYEETLKHPAADSCVTGRVDAPAPVEGLIFVGLFGVQIPQSYPVGGAFLTATGAYHVRRVPDGIYYLLAAALTRLVNPVSYLLPDRELLLVGAGSRPLLVRKGRAYGDTNVMLRPAELTDPPLLISLPLLLTRAAPQAH